MEVAQTLSLPLIENEDRKLDEKDIENNGTGIYEDSDQAMDVNINQQKSFSLMKTIAVIGVLLLVLTLALEIVFGTRWEIIPIVLFCLFGVWFAVIQTQDLFLYRKGTKRMQEVAFWIQQGSNGFFKTQYRTIAIIATLVSCI